MTKKAKTKRSGVEPPLVFGPGGEDKTPGAKPAPGAPDVVGVRDRGGWD